MHADYHAHVAGRDEDLVVRFMPRGETKLFWWSQATSFSVVDEITPEDQRWFRLSALARRAESLSILADPSEELDALGPRAQNGCFADAKRLFLRVATGDELADFLTTKGYSKLQQG